MTRRRSRLIRRDESGATLVEFGILLLPLMMVVLGFCELAYQAYVRSTLQGALNDVARISTVEDPKFGNVMTPLETRIKKRVSDRMSKLSKNGTYAFAIVNYRNFGSVGKAEALVTDVNGNGKYDAGDCWEDTNPNKAFDLDAGKAGVGGADDVVTFDVTMTVPHLFPVMKLFGKPNTFDAKASTMVRDQPYAEQRSPEVAC